MTGHIRKRKVKGGVKYQVILEKGIDGTGKRSREYITCSSYEEAKNTMAQKIHEFNSGSYIEPSKVTVQELCEDWFAVHVATELAVNTQNGYRNNLEKHVYPYIGAIKVQKLTPPQINNMYQKLKGKGLSSRSIRYVHTTLHEALDYAYRLQIVSKNVSEFVTPPKVEKYQPVIYSEEEAILLLNACKGTDHEVPINLAMGLGLRRGEVFGLQWKDIDFSTNTVHICHNLVCTTGKKEIGKTKTETSTRDLLMPQAIVELLKKHKVKQATERLKFDGEYFDNDLVCCSSNGTPRHTGAYSRMFSEFLERKGLKHIRFHDLRHINATLMLQYGVPAKIASERLGHSTIQTTMNIYSHVSVDMQRDSVSTFENNLFAKVAEG